MGGGGVTERASCPVRGVWGPPAAAAAAPAGSMWYMTMSDQICVGAMEARVRAQ